MINKKHQQKQPKESQAALRKLSFAQEGTPQSSWSTILGITNSMVGSVCLVVPQVFKEYGILSCLIVMILLGFIQFKTCSLLLVHQNEAENTTEHMIKRLLGKKWANVFRISSGTLLFIVGVIYFQLINLTLFPIVAFIMEKSGFTNYAEPSDGIVFDKFSIQWQAIIIVLPLGSMLLLKDISNLIKIAHYGVVAIVAYGAFVIYIFIDNIATGAVADYSDDIVLFSWNFSQPAGQFALAFMIHNAVGQLMKNNANKENNIRDLGLAYGLAALIYGTIGIFGAFGLLGKFSKNPSTILDFFGKMDISVLIIELLFLIHLITAFPIFNFISKYQVLEALYPRGGYSKYLFWGYSVFFMAFCLLVQLLNINVGIVIAFDGAVCGFLLIYIIPIYLHFQCYYGKNNGHNNSGSVADSVEDNTYLVEKLQCAEHPNKYDVHLGLRIMVYTGMIGIGVYNLIIQFYELIH